MDSISPTGKQSVEPKLTIHDAVQTARLKGATLQHARENRAARFETIQEKYEQRLQQGKRKFVEDASGAKLTFKIAKTLPEDPEIDHYTVIPSQYLHVLRKHNREKQYQTTLVPYRLSLLKEESKEESKNGQFQRVFYKKKSDEVQDDEVAQVDDEVEAAYWKDTFFCAIEGDVVYVTLTFDFKKNGEDLATILESVKDDCIVLRERHTHDALREFNHGFMTISKLDEASPMDTFTIKYRRSNSTIFEVCTFNHTWEDHYDADNP